MQQRVIQGSIVRMTDPRNVPHDKCDPNEIALKSFFLGPQAENAGWVFDLIHTVFIRWADWRRSLFPEDGCAITEENKSTPEFIARKDRFERVALNLLKRFEDEMPKFSPRYVGHMFSEISLPALVGHVITLLHNPNNVSGEASKVGIKIESEAVQALLKMVGYPLESGTGHFTSGGTIANFEALTRAHARISLWMSLDAVLSSREGTKSFNPFQAAHMGWKKCDELFKKCEEEKVDATTLASWSFERANPYSVFRKFEKLTGDEFLGPVILVPENKHYSWKKGARFLGMGDESLWPVALDAQGKLSLSSLKSLVTRARAECRPVLLVVSVAGTTEFGGIDPVDRVQDFLDELEARDGIHIWHHVDAAYGGFFRTLALGESTSLGKSVLNALIAIPRSTSITLDPHKLGYVPYASGAFLAREKRNYYFSTFDDAPYLAFNENEDPGPYTLEGSRSAAGAVATWMTAQTMGLDEKGYGLLLERTIRSRKMLEEALGASGLSIRIAPGCDTNVVCFTCALPGEPLSASNERTLRVYERFSAKSQGGFIVSKTTLRWKSYGEYLTQWIPDWGAVKDRDEVVLVRMCLMNPFFGSVETKVNYLHLFVDSLAEVLEGLKR